jgi:hypothetical protein
MIQNLLITDIPKDSEAIAAVVNVLQDHTWSRDAMDDWEYSTAKYVWYESSYGQYVTSETMPLDPSLIVKTYEEIICSY